MDLTEVCQYGKGCRNRRQRPQKCLKMLLDRLIEELGHGSREAYLILTGELSLVIHGRRVTIEFQGWRKIGSYEDADYLPEVLDRYRRRHANPREEARCGTPTKP